MPALERSIFPCLKQQPSFLLHYGRYAYRFIHPCGFFIPSKDILPRIISLAILAGIGWFHILILTDREILQKILHYESYINQVIFYSRNFKGFYWRLLWNYGCMYFMVKYANSNRANAVQKIAVSVICGV